MSQSYIPVAAVVPAFAGEELVQVPAEWNNSIQEDMWGVFKQANALTVRRHVKPFRKWCMGCPPCASQESSFSGVRRSDSRSTIHTIAFYEPLLYNPLIPYCSNDWNIDASLNITIKSLFFKTKAKFSLFEH
jgi:hypothetical protein